MRNVYKHYIYSPWRRDACNSSNIQYKYLKDDPSVGRKQFSLRECRKTQGHSMRLEEKQFNLKLHRGFSL